MHRYVLIIKPYSKFLNNHNLPICYQTERYFLLQWIDRESDLYDVLPAHDITPPESVDVLDLKSGELLSGIL